MAYCLVNQMPVLGLAKLGLPETRLSRRYDYQRAKCEDPVLISKWFQLIEAVKAKYGIADNDVYNFDETGFAMGIISTTTVVTGAEARDKAKLAQPGNREWATVIQGIGAEGWAVLPFIILAGQYYLASWYTGTKLPKDWVVTLSDNSWTTNELALEWLKHFNQFTARRCLSDYQLLVLDGHESHHSAAFELYCQEYKIVTIYMPPHSSHILQPLDIGCFGPLKQAYSKEVESLMRAHVNHISKLEFLSGFHKAFTAAMTPKNIRSSFAGAGIVPYDPERVLSKLDMQLPAATPVNSRPGTANAAATWTTKTPLNPSEASLQAGLIKNQITQYQNTSPISLLAAVDQLSKGAQTIMHQMALIRAENTMLRSANEVLNKRRRLKRQRIQHGGTLTIHQADRILDGDATDEVVERPAPPKRQRTPQPEATSGNTRRCGKCGKHGHNIRTCQQESSESELNNVEDMANQLLSTRSDDSTRRVGKKWAGNFVKRRPELQTRLSRKYDYQRAKCEDPALISKWFQLVEAVKAKYGIADNDIYNFDETGFAMGMISTTTVVTGAESRDKAKLAQPGNREWATVIQGVGAEGWALPPFIILAGQYHLASWYTATKLPADWVIALSDNGWTTNELALQWLQHFDKFTAQRCYSDYRLLVLDGHESHHSAAFELYCQEHKIVTICMPPHSSHILQPLDIGCFGPLKQAYSKEVESLIRAHINHISKLEFLSGFHKAFTAAITPKNIRSSFAGAGIVPYNPDRVLSKLDIQLLAATPVNSRPGTANAEATWTTKTPLNPSEASLQAGLIKNQITQYQNTSPTSLLAAVDQLSKGAQTIMHQMALIRAENTTLRSANELLSKRRQLKRQRIQHGGTLTIHQADRILDGDAVDEVVEQPAPPKRQRTPQPEATSAHIRRCDSTPKSQNLTKLEEDVIVQYILELSARSFHPRLGSVEDMANQLLSTRAGDSTRRVGKNWAANFVKRRPELQTRLSRKYDYQRAKCEDPDLIQKWFQLLQATKAKYGITDSNIYNFDETGFAMGMISTTTVVTGAEIRDKAKLAQPGNREWATVIQGIGAEGWAVPPFIILAGQHHLASWYTETNLPNNWAITLSDNGWTTNEVAVEWLKHFNHFTARRCISDYRLLVLDGHNSHHSASFELYCQEHKIITVCMPPHSSHLLQPLDVGCFGPLKQAYSRQVEDLMRAHINHISKLEFLSGFHRAFTAAITPKNIRSSFAGAGIVPYDPDRVLLKLDVQLPVSTPMNSRPNTANAATTWTTKTPINPSEAGLQSELIKNQITQHQDSSPTSLLAAVDQFTKGAQIIMHQLALIQAENTTLRSANEVLSKRRQAKRQRIQHGGTLTIHQAGEILDDNAKQHIQEAAIAGSCALVKREAGSELSGLWLMTLPRVPD
ncbi:NADPH oxidase [Drechslerella dactyloides]|uniref:NADPH oxidase n=1 Tax=Drechslerella dactyloides TaxID=74499 RepID=A0AAD6ITJ6_DREDA|nr:NADPH oxidase [Drechslerella dactyloides]